ncbi:unnamed protein product [Heterobilharzia americana]|nr:unnamed protein product [Heterobilharzia americana]
MDSAEKRRVNKLLRKPSSLGKALGLRQKLSRNAQKQSKSIPTVSEKPLKQEINVDVATLCAEMCGVSNLSESGATLLQKHLNKIARLLIHEVLRVMEQSRRGVPQASDIDLASVLIGLESPFGTTTANFLPVRTGGRTASSGPGGKVFFIRPDKEIDVKALLLREPAGVVYDVSLVAHWLSVNGKQPTSPQNPPPDFLSKMSLLNNSFGYTKQNGDKRLCLESSDTCLLSNAKQSRTSLHNSQEKLDSTSSSLSHPRKVLAVSVERRPHEISQEVMIYFRELTEACVGANETRRHEALDNATLDPGLQPILPHLMTFITEGVRINVTNHNLAILIYLMRLVKALIDNPHISLEPYLHLLVPTVITCVLNRQLCAKPITDNHWALRDFAAKQLATLCNRHNTPSNELYTRVTRELSRALCSWIDGGTSSSSSETCMKLSNCNLSHEKDEIMKISDDEKLNEMKICKYDSGSTTTATTSTNNNSGPSLGTAVHSMNTLYGILVALAEFGNQCLRVIVLPLLSSLCHRLTKLTEPNMPENETNELNMDESGTGSGGDLKSSQQHLALSPSIGDACQTKQCKYYAICQLSAFGEPQCICPTDCLYVRKPVCGTDGKTYENECFLKVKSCADQREVHVAQEGYCRPCAAGCPLGFQCRNGQCVCRDTCPPKHPTELDVCGTDGKLYPSECELKRQSCIQQANIDVDLTGVRCRGRTPTGMQDSNMKMSAVLQADGVRIPTCTCNKLGALSEECDYLGNCRLPRKLLGIQNNHECIPCSCHPLGSVDASCNQATGQCNCRAGVVGRQCSMCPDGSQVTENDCNAKEKNENLLARLQEDGNQLTNGRNDPAKQKISKNTTITLNSQSSDIIINTTSNDNNDAEQNNGRLFTETTTLLVRIPFHMDQPTELQLTLRLLEANGMLLHYQSPPSEQEQLLLYNAQDHQFTMGISNWRVVLKYIDGRVPNRILLVHSKENLTRNVKHTIQTGIVSGRPWIQIDESTRTTNQDVIEKWANKPSDNDGNNDNNNVPTVGGLGTVVIGRHIKLGSLSPIYLGGYDFRGQPTSVYLPVKRGLDGAIQRININDAEVVLAGPSLADMTNTPEEMIRSSNLIEKWVNVSQWQGAPCGPEYSPCQMEQPDNICRPNIQRATCACTTPLQLMHMMKGRLDEQIDEVEKQACLQRKMEISKMNPVLSSRNDGQLQYDGPNRGSIGETINEPIEDILSSNNEFKQILINFSGSTVYKYSGLMGYTSDFNIRLRLRTDKMDGLILLMVEQQTAGQSDHHQHHPDSSSSLILNQPVTQITTNSEFVSLVLRNGRIELLLNLISSSRSQDKSWEKKKNIVSNEGDNGGVSNSEFNRLMPIQARHKVNDGEWHVIQAIGSKQRATLFVDNHMVSGEFSGITDSNSAPVRDVYLGGTLSKIIGLSHDYQQNFTGCIADMLIQERIIPILSEATEIYGPIERCRNI